MKALLTQAEFLLGLVPGFFTVYLAQITMPVTQLVQKWLNGTLANLRL